MSPKRVITAAILLVAAIAIPSNGFAIDIQKVSTVPAKSFNHELRTRWQLTGKPVKKLATERVDRAIYQKLRANNLKTKHLCRVHAKRVRATWYDDATGYRGDNLAANPRNFAELSNIPGSGDYSALGGLPYRTELWFHNRAHDAEGEKLDIGAGGSRHPKVDLWRGKHGLANALHFSDGFVRITKSPCRGVFH